MQYTDVPVGVLLLARTRTPWWGHLQSATESAIDFVDAGDLPLSDHTLDLTARTGQYPAAVAAFAAVMASHGGVPAEPGEVPDLGADMFGDPLMVNLQAL